MTGQSTGCPSSVVVAVAALAAGLLHFTALFLFHAVNCVYNSAAVVA